MEIFDVYIIIFTFKLLTSYQFFISAVLTLPSSILQSYLEISRIPSSLLHFRSYLLAQRQILVVNFYQSYQVRLEEGRS